MIRASESRRHGHGQNGATPWSPRDTASTASSSPSTSSLPTHRTLHGGRSNPSKLRREFSSKVAQTASSLAKFVKSMKIAKFTNTIYSTVPFTIKPCRLTVVIFTALLATLIFVHFSTGNHQTSVGLTASSLFGWNSMPILVVEQHGNVLDFWVQELRGRTGVSVVHVDSHSDMMDVDSEGLPAGRGSTVERMFKRVLKDAAIGDFITRAVLAGIVDSVHWLRSDFDVGTYNGPGVGWYTAVAGIDPEDELACFAELTPVHRTGENIDVKETTEKNNEDSIAEDMEEDEQIAQARNEDTEEFASCKIEDITLHQAPVEVIVSTLDAQVHHDRKLGAPWILDIDFDFLATNDPCIELFEENGFDLQWVQEHVMGAIACPGDREDAEVLSVRRLFIHLAERRGLTSLTSVESALRDAKTNCHVASQEIMNRLLSAIDRFTSEQRHAWNSIFKRDVLEWSGDFIVSILDRSPHLGPIGKPAPREIRAEVARLETWIQAEIEARGPPICVTLSKSQVYDHYLPTMLSGLIEDLVMSMVARLFPERNIVYHSDFTMAATNEDEKTGPPRPVDAADVALLRGFADSSGIVDLDED